MTAPGSRRVARPRSAIAAVSRAAFANGLRQTGFRRQGNHLHRPSADLFHGIHFQAGKWATRSEGKFTINLVVTAPFLYQGWTGKPLPANPATALFPVQQRIGFLLPERRDHWWTVTVGDPIDELADDVTQGLLRYALPFFDEFHASSVLLERLRQERGLPGLSEPRAWLVHAILAQYFDAGDEARTLLQRALEYAGTSPFRATVVTIANRLGHVL
jgi:hypothetical protein